MASATIETFCCTSSRVEPSILTKLQFDSLPYNVICSISSFLGTMGALYQLLPYGTTIAPRHNFTAHRQRAIINWLAFGDLLASMGILIRSIFWICKVDIVKDPMQQNSIDMIICALFSVWVRYFYTTTFLWTLCYAVDVYLVSKQKIGNSLVYHIFTWFISAILTFVGLGTLYLPSFQCHSGLSRVLPNYLLSYIPIILVMFINPVLYFLASKQVRILLTGGLGQLTDQEHNLLAALKEKFFAIVIVFYVCWLPNVLNGIILWGLWYNIPRSTLITVWYIMAVVNPMQAVLNSVVYKGWGNCDTFFSSVCCYCRKSEVLQGMVAEISSKELNLTSGDDRLFLSNNADDQLR